VAVGVVVGVAVAKRTCLKSKVKSAPLASPTVMGEGGVEGP